MTDRTQDDMRNLVRELGAMGPHLLTKVRETDVAQSLVILLDAKDSAALREAAQPFANLAIVDDRLTGLDPEQMRHHVARLREVLKNG